MGFRFSKRVTLFPGCRINLSKSGASLSVGPRGASVNIGKRGVYGNVGIPGTGLSSRERLDKPAPRSPSPASQQRSAAPPPPALPADLRARLANNEIEFIDSRDRLLDPALVPVARNLLKDQVLPFLDAHAKERNEALDALRQLHHDIPAGVHSARSSGRGKPDRASFPSQDAYMQALMTWRAEQANSAPDMSRVEDDLLAALGALQWPAETNIALSLTGSRLLLDVDLPELEDMPTGQWTVAKARLSLEEKAIRQKDVAGLYLDHVCSVLVRLIGHAMGASSAIQTVAVSAYTQRSSACGSIADEYVATCQVSRGDWSQVNLANVTGMDPHNLLRALGAQIATNSRGVLLVQAPLL